MQIEPLDKIQIEGIVAQAIEDAQDFIESEIQPQRLKAQRYYDQECDLGHEDGRSSVVATKCREVVRGIKPSIQRIFLNAEKTVEFVGRNQEDVPLAEQCTQYVNYKFEKCNGYKILSDVIQDALVKKGGVAYAYYDETVDAEIHTYRNLNDDAYAFLLDDDDVEVIEHTQSATIEVDEMGAELEVSTHDVKISRKITSGEIKVESIPPEDFFVDRNARDFDHYYVIGHSSQVRIGDLLELGYDLDELQGISGGEYSSSNDQAEFERRGYNVDEQEDENLSAASRKITLTQAFMELDIEGTGVPRLYQFICAGANHKLLNYYMADDVPYAFFECDPEPHAWFGSSLVDLCIVDQDAATSMLRGMLDNIALTNNPALQVMDGQVAIDDLLNNEIGRIIRVKSPQAVTEFSVPFVAGQTLPAMQYFDSLIDNKTGISKASQGLDADVLQSATATAIAATQSGQMGQAEIIVRNLAEGGMKRLFSLILDLAIKNASEEEIIRLNNQYVPVSPATWHSDMDLIVNVGIGTGRDNERAAALQAALQMQQQIYATYGPFNGLVTLTQIRNTMADLLNIGGVKNAERYFNPMTPEIEQQMLMAQQQQAQQQAMMQAQQPDPAQMLIQSEAMKTQTKAQVDMAKAQMDNQYKMHELSMKDDLARDEMVQDLAIKVAEMLGKYGMAIDVADIKAEQDAVRQHNAQMMGMINGRGA